MSKPEVSIVIPSYNRADLLPQTLLSIQHQTFENWEAIIVDDGSTDHTFEVAEVFAEKDSRFRALQRERTPKGGNTCRNIGAEMAQGKYIVFLDSDDLLAPECLQNRLRHFNAHQNMDFLVFPVMLFHETPGDDNILWNIDNPNLGDIDRFLVLDNPWHTSSPIWKKTAVEKIGGWNETTKSWQDWEYHITALTKRLRYLKISYEQMDCFYRKHPDPKAVSKLDSSVEHLNARLLLFEQVLNTLEGKQLNSEDRKRGLAYLTFQMALSQMKAGHKEMAERSWQFAENNALLEEEELLFWREYLFKGFYEPKGIIKKWMKKIKDKGIYIHKPYHFMDAQGTFLKTQINDPTRIPKFEVRTND